MKKIFSLIPVLFLLIFFTPSVALASGKIQQKSNTLSFSSLFHSFEATTVKLFANLFHPQNNSSNNNSTTYTNLSDGLTPYEIKMLDSFDKRIKNTEKTTKQAAFLLSEVPTNTTVNYSLNTGQISGSLIPETTLVSDLGSQTNYWNNLYTQSLNISGNSTLQGVLTLNNTLTLPNTNVLTGTSSYTEFSKGIGVGVQSGTPTYYINSDGSFTLNNGNFAGGITASGGLTIPSGQTLIATGSVASNFIPSSSGSYNLGSSSNYWSTLYVNSIISPSSGGTSGYLQLNNGVLAPVNITNDFAVGGTSTGSALVKFSGISGNNSWVNTGGYFGVGTTNPSATLDVNGNILTKAGGTFDTETPGTLTIGGTTQNGLTLGRSGATATISASTITLSPFSANGGLLFTNASGILSQTTVGSNGQCLQSVGGGTPTWAACAGASLIQENAGAISPTNITDDLLIGGIATSSAKFQVVGTTGNMVALGHSAFGANAGGTSTTAIMNIAETINPSGGSTDYGVKNQETTNAAFASGALYGGLMKGVANDSTGGDTQNWVAGLQNNMQNTGAATVTNGIGQYTTLDNTSTGTIGTAADFRAFMDNTSTGTISLGYGLKIDGFTNSGGGTFTKAVGAGITDQTAATNNTDLLLNLASIPTGNWGLYDASIYNNYFASPVSIGSTAIGNGEMVVNQPNSSGDIFSASQSGSTKFTITNSGNIAVNGGSITTTQTTANIFNATPTTINLGGVATAVNIGASTGSTTINNNLVLNSNTATTTFGGIAYTWPTSGQSQNYILSTNGSGTLSWQSEGSLSYWQLNSGILAPATITNTLAIGQTTALANSGLDVEQNGLGNSIAVFNQKGGGDILTASVSGSPKFVINNSGYVGISQNNPSYPLHISAVAADIASGAVVNFAGQLNSTTNSQYGLRIAPSVNPGSASTLTYSGLNTGPSSTSTNLTSGILQGLFTNPFYSGTGTLGTAIGGLFKETIATSNTAVITNGYGIEVQGVTQSGCTTCAVTNNAGADIYNQTLGTNNTNLIIGQTNIPSGNYSIYNSSSYGNYFAGGLSLGTTSLGNGQMVVNQPNSAGDIFAASQSGNTKFRISNAGSVVTSNAALATNATDGFLYIPTSAGAPSGTPTTQTGTVALEYDTTNNKLMIYNGGWKGSTTPGAFSDFAEWADAPGATSADIVTITDQKNPTQDSTDPFVLAKSTTPYDSKLAGVISQYAEDANSANGYKKSSDYHAVALIGRVPVKVSSSNGTIMAGDYLTSSSIPGVAQKATKPGTMIGKALESYTDTNAQDIGQIMVLVNVSYADPNYQIALDSTGNLNVNGQSVTNTQAIATTQTPQSESSNGVSADQFTPLQQQVASISVQLGKLDNLSQKLADLEKTVNLNQALQQTSTQSASLTLSNKDQTITGNLTVAGKTLLSDVGITGQVTDGLLAINGMDTSIGTPSATINTLSAPLKIQSLAVAGVDFENEKVTIDTNGNIVTVGDITAKAIKADQGEFGKLNITVDTATTSASIGEATIPVGQMTATINSTAITDSSKVFVTSKTDGSGTLYVISQITGKSFTVKADKVLNKDIHFNWWILN